MDAKTKIYGFATFIEVCKKISEFFCTQFHWLNKCEVTDAAVIVIMDHLKVITSGRKKNSCLKQIDCPTWVMQPMLVDIYYVSMQYQEQHSEMQNNESAKSLFNIGVMAWLCDKTEAKYQHSTNFE